MFKKGFTLAELLITIGLIGVVAALTLPTLMNEAQSKDIGPKLAKAVAVFEQANQSLLNDNEISNFINLGIISNNYVYDELTKYIKMSEIPKYTSILLGNEQYRNSLANTNGNKIDTNSACQLEDYGASGKFYLSKGGVVYIINMSGLINSMQGNFRYMKNPYLRPMGKVMIDVNGKSAPNRTGSDIFEFHWLLDGRLVPYGSSEASKNITSTSNCDWTKLCPIGGYATDTRACPGHIFDNNLKVEYVY